MSTELSLHHQPKEYQLVDHCPHSGKGTVTHDPAITLPTVNHGCELESEATQYLVDMKMGDVGIRCSGCQFVEGGFSKIIYSSEAK